MHSLPTPAHSITGTSSGFDMVEDIDQHRDKRPRLERDQEVDRMEMEPIRQAMNHDRNDQMEVDSERATAAKVDEKTLDQLQEDMGDAFLLCRSSKILLSQSLQVC